VLQILLRCGEESYRASLSCPDGRISEVGPPLIGSIEPSSRGDGRGFASERPRKRNHFLDNIRHDVGRRRHREVEGTHPRRTSSHFRRRVSHQARICKVVDPQSNRCAGPIAFPREIKRHDGIFSTGVQPKRFESVQLEVGNTRMLSPCVAAGVKYPQLSRGFSGPIGPKASGRNRCGPWRAISYSSRRAPPKGRSKPPPPARCPSSDLLSGQTAF